MCGFTLPRIFGRVYTTLQKLHLWKLHVIISPTRNILHHPSKSCNFHKKKIVWCKLESQDFERSTYRRNSEMWSAVKSALSHNLFSSDSVRKNVKCASTYIYHKIDGNQLICWNVSVCGSRQKTLQRNCLPKISWLFRGNCWLFCLCLYSNVILKCKIVSIFYFSVNFVATNRHNSKSAACYSKTSQLAKMIKFDHLLSCRITAQKMQAFTLPFGKSLWNSATIVKRILKQKFTI